MENKKWIVICIIGGILMFVSSVVGNISFYAFIFGIAIAVLGPQSAAIFSIVFLIFYFIALAGGIAVIVGAVIVALNQYFIGKFIISLGAGMGLVSLIILIIVNLIAGSLIASLFGILIGILNGTYGFLGVILTIVARFKLKKKKTSKGK